jgi:hypothetical protein
VYALCRRNSFNLSSASFASRSAATAWPKSTGLGSLPLSTILSLDFEMVSASCERRTNSQVNRPGFVGGSNS